MGFTQEHLQTDQEKPMSFIELMKKRHPSTTEVLGTVLSRVRSADRESYTVVFQEDDGERRMFTKTYSWYGPDGCSAPRPYQGDKEKLLIDQRGELVYTEPVYTWDT